MTPSRASAVPAVPALPGRDELEVLSSAQARRIALAAQGFGARRPTGQVTARRLLGVLEQLGVVQIDSVNVLVRSHYLPFFSRLGPYSRATLDALSRPPRQRVVEYWVHEASLVPLSTHRLLRWRMARAHEEAWGGMRSIARDLPDLLTDVRDLIAEQGPLTAAEVEERLSGARASRATAQWGWNWSDVKRALEFSFWSGQVTSAGRSTQFERRYELPSRVLSGDDALDVDPAQARRELVAHAAAACGVGTAAALRDYHRLRPGEAKPAIDELVEDGVLRPVVVQAHPRAAAAGAGPELAYLHVAARRPGALRASALLSPFDSLIWFRPRTEHLFGMRYRLEVYTPAAKRVHGYYVLPFLLGDELVARVDLKSDRGAGDSGVLLVRASWAQERVRSGRRWTPDPEEIAVPLAEQLESLAAWLGLGHVVVEPVGDLAGPLAHAVARSAS